MKICSLKFEQNMFAVGTMLCKRYNSTNKISNTKLIPVPILTL